MKPTAAAMASTPDARTQPGELILDQKGPLGGVTHRVRVMKRTYDAGDTRHQIPDEIM